jgi:hypothetical protein
MMVAQAALDQKLGTLRTGRVQRPVAPRGD